MIEDINGLTISVEPHPRLLSVLGDIEFAPWQCLAELIDNAFDEFLRRESFLPRAEGEEVPTVWVSLPSKGSSPRDAEVWVRDNGAGMSLEQLNSAMRAGWSSNDRFGNLGLYGVGFNIATARLGHLAIVRTARVEDLNWTVATLDLRVLAAGDHYNLPVTTEPKGSPSDHGTQVVIRGLKAEHHDTLSRQQTKIRSVLGDVYSYLLGERDFRLIVDRNAVKPRQACVWSKDRFVVRRGERIPAVIEIDEPLADRHVCLDCGAWQDDLGTGCQSCGSARLRKEARRIWGWVGVQRYLHGSDYGIDFIRNGRKILLRDLSMFRWDDPDDPGGRGEQEYPLEFPRAGRIIGEIHIDHVRVNYQKNAFEYDTPEWRRVVHTLRGRGPIRPKKAIDAGYTETNRSPLATLVSAYQHNKAGSHDLIPGDGKIALHERAREWAQRFRDGDEKYQTDEEWFKAVKQHDAGPDIPPDPAQTPAEDDILSRKGLLDDPLEASEPLAPRSEPAPTVDTEEQRRTRWREHGRRLPDLETGFGLPGYGAALQVTAYLVQGHRLQRPNDDGAVPVYVAGDKGSAVEVFVDGEHKVFSDFAGDIRDLVVMELADFLRVRSNSATASLSSLFYELKSKCLPDQKIGGPYLTEASNQLLSRLRESMLPIVAGNSAGYWSLLSAEQRKTTERTYALEGGGGRWDELLETGEWVGYVPGMALVRLLGARPEIFLDGRVFRSTYAGLTDEAARAAALERVADLLGDVAVLADRPRRRIPEELQRGHLSCVLLEREIVPAEDATV